MNSIKYFDKLIKINLSELEPHVVGPHTPDHARSISKMAEDVKKNGYIDKISVALIGSCTNSSYEDMSRAASIAEQAKSKGVKIKVPLLVTPGSEMVRATIERDGQMESMKSIGATVACKRMRSMYWPMEQTGVKKRRTQIQSSHHTTETFLGEMMGEERQ